MCRSRHEGDVVRQARMRERVVVREVDEVARKAVERGCLAAAEDGVAPFVLEEDYNDVVDARKRCSGGRRRRERENRHRCGRRLHALSKTRLRQTFRTMKTITPRIRIAAAPNSP